MIKAKVTSVTPALNGRDAQVFARAQSLVSPENPRGEVMFYAVPPFWTGGRNPYAGQAVMIGNVERKTNSRWRHAKWLARDVSPAQAIESYSRKRLQEPTTIARPAEGWFARLLGLLGLRPLTISKVT